jgi:hypothetical protein
MALWSRLMILEISNMYQVDVEKKKKREIDFQQFSDLHEDKLDKHLRPLNSPMTRVKKMTAYDFSHSFEAQSSVMRTGDIKATNMVKLGNNSFGTVSGMANNSSLLVNVNLTPKTTFKNSHALGMPCVSMYIGTTTSPVNSDWQIYPKQGGSVSYSDWRFVVGNDWGSSDNNNIKHQIVVINESGTVQNFVIAANVRYVQNNAGVSL